MIKANLGRSNDFAVKKDQIFYVHNTNNDINNLQISEGVFDCNNPIKNILIQNISNEDQKSIERSKNC